MTARDSRPDAVAVSHSSPLPLPEGSAIDYAIAFLDPAGNVQSWSTGAQRMEGHSAKEIIGRHFSCFYTPADVAGGKPDKELAAARSAGHYQQEGLRVRKNGATFHAGVTITALYDASQKLTGFATVTWDITEAKLAENTLRVNQTRRASQAADEKMALLNDHVDQQRDRLDAIISSVPGVVWEAWGKPEGTTQRINFVSDYVQTMLGYSVEEWLSTPTFWISIVHPDDRERVARETAANFVANTRNTHEFRWVCKDGRVLWVEATYVVIGDESGQPIGMRGVTVDITERRQAEATLRETEERYRQLFETNPDPTFIFDRETLCFLAFNEAAVVDYGYSRDELYSLTARDIWPAGELPAFVQRLAELPNGPPQGTTWKHQQKDGTIIDVEITRRPMLFGSSPAWVMLAHNVTARKALEEQLRQSQKMDAVGQLAGGMAHDFNNLLTVINGYSDLAKGRLPAEDPMRQDMEQIRRAGERAAALTRQLLAFSRKQIRLLTVLDLNAVIAELETMLRRLIGEDIDLSADLAPDAGNVKADRGQIEQVVMNLVVNARDAMPSGGKLSIETRNVLVTEDALLYAGVKPGPYVMLTVTDAGVGMEPQVQARIFEPFFTTKEAGKGTGLGLSTVYRIVQQSGGSIRVHSEVGRGSTFKVYLPRLGDAPRRDQGPAPGRAPEPETVLLTEDDASVRALTRRVLATHGYHVLEAANGDAAISICDGHAEPIHLLITDVVMPGMSGRTLADRLEKLRPGIKVLYMSGYTDRAVVEQQVMDEKAPFIQKPFTPQSLLLKIREILDSNAAS